MGILVFYEGDGRIAGDISSAQWKQIRRLLPLAIDLINSEMTRKRTEPVSLVATPFRVEKLLRDESATKEEINLLDDREWRRLLAWWEFLSTNTDEMRFYKPMIEIIKTQTQHPNAAH